jgi:hypothetical protein
MREEITVERVEGDVVGGQLGVRDPSGDLDLSPMGLGVVSPTGRTASARLRVAWTVAGDRIVSMEAKSFPGEGVEAVLAQIGVELPGAQ